ncbi:hypothetical protein QES_1561 [Clostridioides difficile CD149]|nr:hypothetical protein QAO_1270 [Clostridioides difficile CD3]EQE13350.1 hypothetical protein QAQ_1341 [Clostridioides difficile CD8]EQE20871.1 hypothetical protein QAW_1525 [Clostridioides difficile CD17]EQE21178.1 hypothetical protein QAY_1215 [Clostridioides difficile CD18]EQE26922.1 hypothetical protein QC1_1364 [Clostridioides difficile CD21]EQE31354.1 hypothetical protein QC3_1292 [Clostridioides difficile CD22]EQE34341.1 hypothetical protein QC5_1282 [Clostridioides difficile CD34]EQ
MIFLSLLLLSTIIIIKTPPNYVQIVSYLILLKISSVYALNIT